MENSKSPTQSKVTWRDLTPNDIDSLLRIANIIHPDLPESASVFLERIELFPEGCVGLVEEGSNELSGYAISHPIRCRQPPALDSLLGEIAPDADQYYIHDLAILPRLRGRGLAQKCICRLISVGRMFQSCGLVSVYGTDPFWASFGFDQPGDIDEVLKEKLKLYGDKAKFMESV